MDWVVAAVEQGTVTFSDKTERISEIPKFYSSSRKKKEAAAAFLPQKINASNLREAWNFSVYNQK